VGDCECHSSQRHGCLREGELELRWASGADGQLRCRCRVRRRKGLLDRRAVWGERIPGARLRRQGGGTGWASEALDSLAVGLTGRLVFDEQIEAVALVSDLIATVSSLRQAEEGVVDSRSA